jgi:hypothetical protein
LQRGSDRQQVAQVGQLDGQDAPGWCQCAW